MKHLGLISILFVLTSMLFLMRRWYTPGTKTTSKVAASHRTAYILFAITLSIGGLVFLVFMLRYFIPEYHYGWPLKFMIFLAVILQLLTAWIPDIPGAKGKVHALVAHSLGASLMYLAIIITLNTELSRRVRIADTFLVIVMTFLAIKSLVISHKKYIFYQQIYIFAFWLLILVTTYVR